MVQPAAGRLIEGLMSHDVVALGGIGRNGRLSMLSESLQVITGRQYQSLPWTELAGYFGCLHADGLTPMRPHEVPLVRARRGEVLRGDKMAITRPDGSVRFLQAHAAPTRDVAGTIDGGAVMVVDVTEEARVMKEQQTLLHAVVTWLNHELRTPLAAVVGHAELIEELAGSALPTYARNSIRAIERGGSKLHEVIESMSDVIDVAAVGTDMTLALCDIGEAVRELAVRAQRLAEQEGVRVACRFQEESPITVRTDKSKLVAAVTGLIRQAVRHCPADQAVVVDIHVEAPKVVISVLTPAGHAQPASGDLLHERRPFTGESRDDLSINTEAVELAIAQAVAIVHGGRLITVTDDDGFRANIELPIAGTTDYDRRPPGAGHRQSEPPGGQPSRAQYK
jgi:signal transduction histidine kinase